MCLLTIKDDACTSEPGKSCEQVEPIMADDGSGADITIPSFLLYKPDADKIKAELKKEHSVQVPQHTEDQTLISKGGRDPHSPLPLLSMPHALSLSLGGDDVVDACP